MSRNFTDEQKENIIKAVEKARDNGTIAKEAFRQQGIQPSLYYGWVRKRNAGRRSKKRKQLALVPAKAVHHTFPVEPRLTTVRTEGSVVISGTPEDIGLFLRSVANGGG